MQKIPTWYGPDFFPDQRASGQPSKYVVGTDVGIFPFPTIDPAQNNVEGSADTMMMLADRPEVRAVAEFLATPQGIQSWIEAGSAISTNTTTPADWYAGAYKLKVASDIASTATGIGFDASDLMPGQGRRRYLLDQDGRLGQQRWHQYRCHPEGHRRQLARQLSHLMACGARHLTVARPATISAEEGRWPSSRRAESPGLSRFVLPILGPDRRSVCASAASSS